MEKSLFSTVTSQIALANYCDGNRVQMASSMIRQAQPIQNAEPPIIVTSQQFIDIPSYFVQKAVKNGTIIDKISNYIIVEYEDGELDYFFLSPYHKGVKNIGDTVSPGDIVVQHILYDPLTKLVWFGRNAHVMFASNDSYTHEDAVVITELGQENFTYLYSPTKTLEMRNIHEVLILEKDIRPGVKVRKGECLATIKTISSSLQSLISNLEMRHIYADEDMLITEVYTIFDEKFLQNQPEKTKQFLQAYNVKSKENDKYAKYAVKSISYDGVCYIILRGVDIKKPKIGDKFANIYGNKGVVSEIIPTFYVIDDINDIKYPIEVIHTPVGVPSRMNYAQILYMHLAYICRYIIPKELKKYKDINDKIGFLYKFYHAIDPIKSKDFIQILKQVGPTEGKRMINDIETNGFHIVVSQFTFNMFEKVKILMKEMNVPSTFIDERTGLRYGSGLIYTMLLEHLAEKKIRKHSIEYYDRKTFMPSGHTQRMGEMEIWTIAAYNVPNYLHESLTIRSDAINEKEQVLKELLNQGYAHIRDARPKSLDVLKAYLNLLSIELDDDNS